MIGKMKISGRISDELGRIIYSDFSLLERAEVFRRRRLRGGNDRASRRIKLLRRSNFVGVTVMGVYDEDKKKTKWSLRNHNHKVRRAVRQEIINVLSDIDKVSDPLGILDEIEETDSVIRRSQMAKVITAFPDGSIKIIGKDNQPIRRRRHHHRGGRGRKKFMNLVSA